MSFWKPASIPLPNYDDVNIIDRTSTITSGEGSGDIIVNKTTATKKRGYDSNAKCDTELLPINKHKKEILYALEKYDIIIIVGETGNYIFII